MSANLMTSVQIRNYIKCNPNLSRPELAINLNLTEKQIKAHQSWITRGAKADKNESIVNVIEALELNKVEPKKRGRKAVVLTEAEKREKKRLSNQKYNQMLTEKRRELRALKNADKPTNEGKPKKINKVKLDVVKVLPKPLPKTDTYHNEYGENKEVARVKMANYVTDSNVIGRIVSLSHIECDIERKIENGVVGNTFICVNNVEETYNLNKAFIKANKLPFFSHYGNMSDLIYNHEENSYAHLVLDYCCQLPTASNEIEYAIDKKLVQVGGYMLMTFSRPIRLDDEKSNKIKSLGNKISNVDDVRSLSDRAIENYFYNVMGKNFEFVETFYYKDTYPMVLIVLKRIK